MLRRICLLISMLGICFNNQCTGPGDMSMQLADRCMQPARTSMPASARTYSPNAWCWENPLLQGNKLLAVWGTDANNVWAVGDSGTIPKWNGTAWAA